MAQNQNIKISPAQRANLFAQATRQNMQMLPSQSGAASSVISFTLPKVRLLSKIRLYVSCVLTAVEASATAVTPAPFAPYSLLKRVEVSVNNGFAPFITDGKGLYFYNLLRNFGDTVKPYTTATTGRQRNRMGLVSAATTGAANTVQFVVDLPITLNDRDPIGLILLQNEETVVSVNITLGTAADLAPAASGFTFSIGNVTITPMIETFSIPSIPEAFPDLSILKLYQSTSKTIAGAGEVTLPLKVGLNYRKLLVYLEDASGGEADSDLSGDIELVMNQADIPYRIKPQVLAAINQEQYGCVLPNGLFVFDFSSGMGLANYGGGRDYIDTERLTEFWVRLQAAAAGTITAYSEMLAQLT